MLRTLVRSLMVVMLTAVVGGGLMWSFWPQPVLVELTSIGRGRLQVTVDDDGKTRIKERYIVSSPLGGRLDRIQLDPGDPVVAGETLLATIEPNEPELLDPRARALAEARVKAAEASLARAEPLVERSRAELAFAESNLGRSRELAQTNAVSVERLEEAEMLHRARARTTDPPLSPAMWRVLNWKWRGQRSSAPVPTTPRPRCPAIYRSRRQSAVGCCASCRKVATVVQPGTQLLELGDPADLEVEVDVLSSEAVKIRPQAKALLERWGGEQPLPAVVRLIEPAAFTKVSALGVEEQRVNVILDLLPAGTEEQTLGDGFRVEARILIWEEDDVLQAPTGALFRHDQEWSVFVVSDGKARLRRVTLGQRNSLAAQVLEGLQEGEQVILHPSDQVHDGIAVQQRNVSVR